MHIYSTLTNAILIIIAIWFAHDAMLSRTTAYKLG
jgi:hypothetical protein